MTITLTSATLPVFKNSLTNLSHCLNDLWIFNIF